MTSRDLYTLLHLLHAFDVEEGRCDTPEHLATLVLKIAVERKLEQKRELG